MDEKETLQEVQAELTAAQETVPAATPKAKESAPKTTATKTAADEQAAREARMRRNIENISCVIIVLFAIFLWMYVKTAEVDFEERQISNVQVALRGTELVAYSPVSKCTETLDVTVRGRRADIEDITAADLVAYVDLSEVAAAGKHSLEVQFESLPDGVSIAKQSRATVVIYMDKTATHEIPLVLKAESFTCPAGSTVGTPEAADSVLHVTGPSNLLSTVARVELSLSLGNVSTSLTTQTDPRRASVVLYDNAGAIVDSPYLMVADTSLSVYVPLYVTKQLNVKIDNATDFSGVQYAPATVWVRGKSEDIGKLGVHSLGRFEPGATVREMAVVLPTGITFADGAAQKTVTVTVTPKN